MNGLSRLIQACMSRLAKHRVCLLTYYNKTRTTSCTKLPKGRYYAAALGRLSREKWPETRAQIRV